VAKCGGLGALYLQNRCFNTPATGAAYDREHRVQKKGYVEKKRAMGKHFQSAQLPVMNRGAGVGRQMKLNRDVDGKVLIIFLLKKNGTTQTLINRGVLKRV
jgi:hypothetical protein